MIKDRKESRKIVGNLLKRKLGREKNNHALPFSIQICETEILRDRSDVIPYDLGGRGSLIRSMNTSMTMN